MMKHEMSSYFEDSEFKASLAKYEGMVNSHTPCYFDADELVDIADYYAFNGRHAEAEAVIDYALHLHPDHTDVLIFRSRSLALKGNLEEAYQVASLIDDPTDREVIFLRADLLMEENRLEEAEALLTQLACTEDYSPEVITDILQDFLDNDQKERADKWFRELETRYSVADLITRNRHIQDVVASYYCQTNDYEKAIPLLKQILDDDPYSIENWSELGRCYMQSGNLNDAHEAIDFALAINENDYESIHLKALCTLRSGNSEKAVALYKRLLDFPEKQVVARLSLSKIYQSENNFEASFKLLQPLFEQENELSSQEKAEFYSHYALYCAYKGKREEGEIYLQKSIKEAEYKEEVQMDYGRFFLKLCQHSQAEEEKAYYRQEAARHFQQGLDASLTQDNRLLSLLNIASSYFDVYEYENACTYFELIVQEFPQEGPTTYIFLIYGYCYTGKQEKMYHYLARMKKELPELYNELGTTDAASLSDVFFMSFIQILKIKVEEGVLDLDQFL